MSANPQSAEVPSNRQFREQLDSWKEIAAYLKRGITTVQRWEREEGLPVHRLQHDSLGSVYAFTDELEVWRAKRGTAPQTEQERSFQGYAAVSALRALVRRAVVRRIGALA